METGDAKGALPKWRRCGAGLAIRRLLQVE
jgi:hypothetical protein